MTRNELAARINAEREQLRTAGKIHRRDLMKHICRMEKELKTYDFYRNGG